MHHQMKCWCHAGSCKTDESVNSRLRNSFARLFHKFLRFSWVCCTWTQIHWQESPQQGDQSPQFLHTSCFTCGTWKQLWKTTNAVSCHITCHRLFWQLVVSWLKLQTKEDACQKIEQNFVKHCSSFELGDWKHTQHLQWGFMWSDVDGWCAWFWC